PVLLPDERWVLTGGADATEPEPPGSAVPELVAAAAAAFAGRPAVLDGDGAWTYWQLLGAANGIAARLHADGHRPGDVVGVCVERSRHTVSAMLGVFAAGCVYLPLDPRWPPARLAAILPDSGARTAIVSAAT